RDLAGVFAGVGEATVQALFLVGEGDHADRARRTLGQVRDELGRGHGDADAGGVVDRPGALVPGIQVAADQHDLVGPAAAGDLADHVLRGVFAVPAAIQRHAYARAGIERDQARELVGVRVGEGGGGNRLQALGETGDAGMPEALVAGAGRAHQEGAGTGADRRRGTGAAQARGRTVAVPVAGALHAVVHERDLPGERARACLLQRGQVREAHHHALDGAARAAAQGAEHQRLRVPAEYLGRLAAALPL